MANKPLQSIKFPGLADTYIVPQIDNTLTHPGQAADAKAVGDKISELKNALDDDSNVFNVYNGLVNYNYDTAYQQNATGSTWKNSIAIRRNKTYVELNRSTIPSGQLFIRLSGAVDLQSLNENVDGWTTGIELIEGHIYRAKAILISGTSIYDETVGQLCPQLLVVPLGSHTSISTSNTNATSSTVEFTAGSGKYNLALFFNNRKYTLASVKLVVLLEDCTESRLSIVENETGILEKESEVNRTLIDGLHSLVNYGYDTPINIQKGDGSTWNKCLGINRYKNEIVLNKTAQTNTGIYIKLNGTDAGQYAMSQRSSWTDSLTLIAGHKYRSTVKYVSGYCVYGEDEGYIPPCNVYKVVDTEFVRIIGHRINNGLYTVDFEAEEDTPYFLYLYVPPSTTAETIYNNLRLVVTMEDTTTYTDDDNLPLYYADYLAERIPSIIETGLNIEQNGLRFIFFTDYHVQNNKRNSGSLIYKICKETGIKSVVFGGDSEQSETTKAAGYEAILSMISDFSEVAKLSKMYYITGNHEMNDPNNSHSDRRLSESMIGRTFYDQMENVEMLFDECNSFYHDDDFAKIRIYFIGCDKAALITVDTRDKVINSLLNVPEGYSVLLISHVGLAWDNNLDKDVIEWRAKTLIEVCTAMNEGTQATVYLGPNSTLMRQPDFTGKQRNFIGMISGHTHRDNYVIHDSKFPIISTACDAYAVKSTKIVPPHNQEPGTIYEQCFDVVQIDNVNKYIYMTRIGDGYDRVFKYGTNAGLVV